MDHHKDDHSGHGFAKGQEKVPDDHEKEHEGDFGSGQETHDAAREKVRSDFARGEDEEDPSAKLYGPTTRAVRTTTSDRLDDRAKNNSRSGGGVAVTGRMGQPHRS
jgi:hypothetical protein